MTDGRRRYCSVECFEAARRERDRRRKWAPTAAQLAQRQEASRKWKRAERSKVLVARYMMQPETRARRALLFNAHEEARQRGVNVRVILEEWSAPLGRAGLVAMLEGEPRRKFGRCLRCGKQRALAKHKERYCSLRCLRKARQAYMRRRGKVAMASWRARLRARRNADLLPGSTPALRQSTAACP